MAEAVTRKVCRLPLLLALLALPSAVFAHRDDQYLQATLVIIEPSEIRLQINLTPGVAVAEQVLARIDRDRDGAISKNEAAAYAQLLMHDLTLRVDGRKLELKLTASEFVEPAELRTGAGIIQLEVSAISGPLAAGAHRLTLENRHLTTMSVYLINAAQPRFATVQITRQKRNENQSAGEIEFTVHPFPPKIAESGARP
jgi:polyphosphate kinase